MNKLVPIVFLLVLGLFVSCERQLDENPIELELDFQPLEVGNYWIYNVEETIYYGENDSEDDAYFLQDIINSTYINEANEVVFIVQRSKSYDQFEWEPLEKYTLLRRGKTLIRTKQNQPVVTLVFPPNDGAIWDSNNYLNAPEDIFEIKIIPVNSSNKRIQVNQEEADDLITYRDHRYEVFEKGIGLVEDYEEVLTYCSRNDCLGDQLIDGGSKLHLIITEHGKL
ncbi:hypothetical protein JYB62_05305 [Algoriphagus lutimaris]|uniref:hypothetical protein n=1 Tax=Algoriphagus lutimaris TaxID=613197 RepID=UPI00196A543B|nr:hypothetical protein [Algoriphagus lutimaris]MBN3519412.1 hypothetical protein [Algoriphagus lutimaris]